MPYVTGNILPIGAVLDVLVGVPAVRAGLLRKHGFAIPTPVPVRALIDTGASLSAFTPRVFDALDLRPLDQIAVLTPSTKPDVPHIADWHQVSLSLVADGRECSFPDIHVMSADCWLESEGMEALIGRDILDRCFFQYFGLDRRFTLAF
jgi:hypothetical protein